ncbi:glycerate kinase [Marivirga salinae]|uniref:Glycerate kinase n=1 Tax=Marivirga salinarum TaxID=3059078 RepID=A0AA51NC16_9BACT|nr:glycerate kinase [Marivirga sp. BDSF4-3]WMN12447.1 glycerate kinase [Marivirga sp. BDSF4-3]
MKILIAPDKFKHSLTAQEVCKIIENGLKEKSGSLEIESFPMADGGEGTSEILALQANAKPVSAKVHDPLMRNIEAQYFIKDKTAFIEMASASGLQLLKSDEQNVLKTTSFGTGELIKDGIIKGCNEIILCIGGSATSDGGAGMASALGFQFLNDEGEQFIPTAENLHLIKLIKMPEDHFFKDIKVSVLTDVNNPLTGKNGASYQYAIQKGALEKDLEFLDKGMQHLKDIIFQQFNFNIDQHSGAGASGGMGGGSTFFLNADLHSGIEFIADALNLEDKVKNADLVISGEGKLDTQSFQGKVVSGVLNSCQKLDKSLFLVVGYNGYKSELPKEIKAVISLTDLAKSQEEAIKKASFWLQKAAFQLFENTKTL